MPSITAKPISAQPITARPLSARYIGNSTATALPWADQMLASYRSNPALAAWLDANAGVEAELLSRLQPGGYLHTTFGPSGQNKTQCDFLIVMKITGDIAAGATTTKSGDALRWDIDGNIATQNNMPAYTLGAGAGVVTLSTTDGWSGITQINWSSRPINLDIAALSAMTALAYLYLHSTGVSGDVGALSTLTALVHLYLYATGVSGDVGALSTLTALTRIILNNTGVSGDAGTLLTLPDLEFLYLYSTGVVYNSNTFAFAGMRGMRLYDCNWPLGMVDQFIADMYAAWSAGTFTYATPTLNIGGNNAAPSGNYAQETPPVTGKGKIFEMVNDPQNLGHPTWTITYTA